MIGTRAIAAVALAAVVTLGLPVSGLAAPTAPVKLTARTTSSHERWLTGSDSLTQIAAISRRDALHFFNSSSSFVIKHAVIRILFCWPA